MATWAELVAEVYSWTARPDMVVETELALRQAIRTAHRLGKFSKDLTTVTVAPPLQTIQTVDIETSLPRFKQLSYVKSGSLDFYYDEATAQELLDYEGYVKQNVYWNIGTVLNIRAAAAEDSYEIAYYLQPITAPPTAVVDWLLTDYSDVVMLLAVGTVLGLIGEQEIKSRADTMLALAASGLIADNTELTGR